MRKLFVALTAANAGSIHRKGDRVCASWPASIILSGGASRYLPLATLPAAVTRRADRDLFGDLMPPPSRLAGNNGRRPCRGPPVIRDVLLALRNLARYVCAQPVRSLQHVFMNGFPAVLWQIRSVLFIFTLGTIFFGLHYLGLVVYLGLSENGWVFHLASWAVALLTLSIMFREGVAPQC